MDRIGDLIDILNQANAAYELGTPVMSDFEYDALYDELLSLEAASGDVRENSPTQRTGHEIVSSLAKVRHDSAMLSLDKTKDTARLAEFLGEREGVLSWKLDGLSVVLKYSGGQLTQALTRGNGEIGEDVTHNARYFRNIPRKIDFDGILTLRGEAIITFTEFSKINADLEDFERYKNPRNLCAGTIRQLNTRVAAARNVQYYSFSIVQGPNFAKKSAGLTFLRNLGFDVTYFQLVNAQNVAAAVEDFKELVESQDFATDGLVLTFDDVDYSRELGATSKFPRDSLAFKWADEVKITRLLEIEWSTSRTGLINPIAVFEPVNIEGTTVERASLHNISILDGLRLGIGDEIKVYKANMIIPQIAENLTKSGSASPPGHCPVCDSITHIKEENDTKTLHCTNPNCRARVARTITHYAARDAMNIEGFSIQTVEKFIDAGFLTNISDIYTLDAYEAEITAMTGFGNKSFAKMMAAIEKSKTAALPNFIFALGIDNVGLAGAKLLCRHFDNDLTKIRAAMPDELIEIEGFGQVIADSLHSYFQNADNNRFVDAALRHLTFIESESVQIAQDSPISGKTFVITGDVHGYANRKELQEFIESLGGKVTGSVTKKTDFLINNDATSESSKNKKARELGVAVITEEGFAALLR